MTLQEQIRQEQNAQIAAPRRPYQWLAQSVSNLFHPLLVLTASAVVVCFFTPMTIFTTAIKAFFVGEVAFYSLLMPVLIITLLHVFHVIGHWALRDRRDRSIPFLTNFICYTTLVFVLSRSTFLPFWVMIPYYGASVLTFVAWVISFWWKVSAHASADSAFVTYMVLLTIFFPDWMPLWLVFVPLVIVGAVCTTRLYLGRHTLAQVGVGSLLGVASMLLGLLMSFIAVG